MVTVGRGFILKESQLAFRSLAPKAMKVLLMRKEGIEQTLG